MANKMSDMIRTRIIEVAREHGYPVVLRRDGSDEYVKVLMFRMPKSRHFLFIDKETATNVAGVPNHFKVAVHPDLFRPDLVDASRGVTEALNKNKGQNLFHSSNYRDFPRRSGKEPCAKCYKAQDCAALEHLLEGLAKGPISRKVS